MKFFAGLLLLSCVLYTSAESYELQPRAIPQSCEDVLAQDLCDQLKEIAAAFKLQASKVDDAIKDAIIKGIVSAPDVYRAAKAFLKNEVLAKSCEDLLASRICDRLRNITKALKIRADKVEEAIREVIGEGITRGTVVYVKVLDYFKKEVLSKTCEDYLAPTVCTKLRSIAATFKLKVETVNAHIVDAIIQGYENKDEIYEAVLDFIRQEVLSKTCEDVLAAPICSQLRAIATQLKVKVSQVDKFVREAVLKGKNVAADIIEAVRDYLLNEVLAKTCEDFLPDKLCTKLRELAAKLKVKVELVDKAVKEAIVKGKARVTEIYQSVVEYLKENIQCEDFLSTSTCDRIRKIAKRFGVLRDTLKFMRDTIASGISTVSGIVSSVMTFLRSKIFG